VSIPDIFDRTARRLRRDRAAANFADHDFLRAAMLDGIQGRLDTVTRGFEDVLDLGCFDGAFQPPPGARITRCDAGSAFATIASSLKKREFWEPEPEMNTTFPRITRIEHLLLPWL